MKQNDNQHDLKPLSFRKFLFKNKGKSLGMAATLALSVFLVLVSQMVFYAVVEGPRLGSAVTDYGSIVYAGEKGVIDLEFKEELKANDLVEKVIPVKEMNTDYYHFFGAANMLLFFVEDRDMDYIMNKASLKLIEGRMPRAGMNEILVDWRLANNKSKAVGDYVGKEIDAEEKIFGAYQIVGLIDGPCIIALSPQKDNSMSEDRQVFVFPKQGKREDLNIWLSSISSDKAFYWTKKKADRDYREASETIDRLSGVALMGIIFVMAFAAGNSCYSQYFSRRYEFGVLQALGYTKSQILVRAAKEIVLINMIGLLGGIFVGLVVGVILNQLFFIPKGYPFVLLQYDAVIKALVIPASTILFGLIPAGLLLSTIDPMIVIEKFE